MPAQGSFPNTCATECYRDPRMEAEDREEAGTRVGPSPTRPSSVNGPGGRSRSLGQMRSGESIARQANNPDAWNIDPGGELR